MSRLRLSGLLVLLTVATVPLVADTLVVRDGRRVPGTLVGVRDDTIAWTDTGIDVRRGQQIYLDASGEIRWGTGSRKDGPNSGTFRVVVSY